MTTPVSNTYLGDGTTVLFPFTFEYIETADVYVRIDDVTQEKTTWSFANATTVQMNVAPEVDARVKVFRRTTTDQMPATFFNGSTIQAPDLNDNFNVVLFVAQETQADGTGAADDALAALTIAKDADAKADAAVLTVDQAVIASDAAVVASQAAEASAAAVVSVAATAETNAATAETNAAEALTLATNADATASGLAGTITTADQNATAALNTANTADANASTALSTANSADAKADTAIVDSATALANSGLRVSVSEIPPTSPEAGYLWWADTTASEGGGRLYTYTGSEWVDVSIPGASLTPEDAEGFFLSKVHGDTASGKINFNKGLTAAGVLTSYTTGLNLQYSGSSNSDIIAWRSGASDGILRFFTTDGDSDPVERLRISGQGEFRFNGSGPGRIYIDANQATSGYDSLIQQTNEGLEFTAKSNSRGFVFNTGSTPTAKVNIKAGGNVGIGIDPTQKLHVAGDGLFTGNITAGNVSDVRFKENITDAHPQLADVIALGSSLKNWDWKEDAPLTDELKSKRFLGLIAQEAEVVCPSLTYTINRTQRGAELTPEEVIPAVYEEQVVPAFLDEEGKVLTPETTEQVLVTEEQFIPATYEELDDSYKAINHDILIMKLLGAVAELKAEIEALKTPEKTN